MTSSQRDSTDQGTAQIGVTGLAVMGRNLARNLARHGYTVALHNRTYSRTQSLVADHGDEGTFVPSESLEDFVASLELPRAVIIMVTAGDPTDAVIDELVPLLDSGDIIIDCGNAHFADTRRREQQLREQGLHFVGSGVSGGEEGALNGPSIMPGGSPESYQKLGPMFESIATGTVGDSAMPMYPVAALPVVIVVPSGSPFVPRRCTSTPRNCLNIAWDAPGGMPRRSART